MGYLYDTGALKPVYKWSADDLDDLRGMAERFGGGSDIFKPGGPK